METPKQFEPQQVDEPALDFHGTTHAWVDGYNECLDKTNAKELYEALRLAKEYFDGFRDIRTGGVNALKQINQALDKANK